MSCRLTTKLLLKFALGKNNSCKNLSQKAQVLDKNKRLKIQTRQKVNWLF